MSHQSPQIMKHEPAIENSGATVLWQAKLSSLQTILCYTHLNFVIGDQ